MRTDFRQRRPRLRATATSTTIVNVSRDVLARVVTGRRAEWFVEDVDAHRKVLHAAIAGRRILVIGGAGSIGAATIRGLVAFHPAALHVIDQSENTLVELVRDVRSGVPEFAVPDFRTLPVDYGSPIMQRFLRDQPPYDLVLNFAALKHVRSEKDVYSTLQMLDTNLIKTARLLRWLAERGGTSRYFAVSTDKAANPVNLMGASKRLMEHVMFSGAVTPGSRTIMTSARFANVAFSDGSLLDGWLHRLHKRQPLAVPRNTRRFFLTLRESGRICLLAAVCAKHRQLLIPRMHAARDLRDLQAVVSAVLGGYGLAPRFYEEAHAAKTRLAADLTQHRYPVMLTPLDTTGEKPYEEFVGAGERAVDMGFAQLRAVPYVPAPSGAVTAFLRRVEELLAHPERTVRKEELVRWMTAVVPELRHVEMGRTLDERM